MTTSEKLAILREWQDILMQSDARLEPVIEALQLHPESPVCEAVWGMQSAYTNVVSKLVGDEADWLSWYASDNRFGGNAMEAGVQGDLRPIVTLEDLLWVIEVKA